MTLTDVSRILGITFPIMQLCSNARVSISSVNRYIHWSLINRYILWSWRMLMSYLFGIVFDICFVILSIYLSPNWLQRPSFSVFTKHLPVLVKYIIFVRYLIVLLNSVHCERISRTVPNDLNTWHRCCQIALHLTLHVERWWKPKSILLVSIGQAK